MARGLVCDEILLLIEQDAALGALEPGSGVAPRDGHLVVVLGELRIGLELVAADGTSHGHRSRLL
jgi:hypothetical protein